MIATYLTYRNLKTTMSDFKIRVIDIAIFISNKVLQERNAFRCQFFFC